MAQQRHGFGFAQQFLKTGPLIAALAGCADGGEADRPLRTGREVEMGELDARPAALEGSTCSWSAATSQLEWTVGAVDAATPLVLRQVAATKAIQLNESSCAPSGAVPKVMKLKLPDGAKLTVDYGFGGAVFLLGVKSGTADLPGLTIEAAGAWELSLRGTEAVNAVVASAGGVTFNGDRFREVAWDEAPTTLRVSVEGGNDRVSGVGFTTTGALAPYVGPMRVFGGEGNDALQGGDGADLLSGEGGNDSFATAPVADGADVYLGGVGVDSMSYAKTSIAGMKVHDPRWHTSLGDPERTCLGKTPVRRPGADGLPCSVAKPDARGHFGVLVVTGAWQDGESEAWRPLAFPQVGSEAERCASQPAMIYDARLKREVASRTWTLSAAVARSGELAVSSGRIVGFEDEACAARFERGGLGADADPTDPVTRWCLGSIITEGDLFDGVETIVGTAGQDVMYGAACEKVVFQGLAGDDVLYPGAGGEGSEVDGGAGDDLLIFGLDVPEGAGANGAATFTGGAGTDMVTCAACGEGVAITVDGKANDGFRAATTFQSGYVAKTPCRRLRMTGLDLDNVKNDVEVVEGGAGADGIYASTGDRMLGAGLYGDDLLIGGKSRDLLYAGALATGGDLPLASEPNGFPRVLRGFALRYGHFRGSVAASPTNAAFDFPRLRTDEVLTGRAILCGADGQDTLVGSSGTDYLYGGRQDDVLYGYEGADVMNGSVGQDWLDGGSGLDVMSGSSGADIVVCGGGVGDRGATDRLDVVCVPASDATKPYVGPGWSRRPVVASLCNGADRREKLSRFASFHSCEGARPNAVDLQGPAVAVEADVEIPVCTPACENGGECQANKTCLCDPGWTGPRCQTATCTPACTNGETCLAPDDCGCAPQTQGDGCTTPVSCAAPCLNGGVCEAGATGGPGDDVCACVGGYSGAQCELDPPPECDPPCQNGGECVEDGVCECVGGYTGPRCMTSPAGGAGTNFTVTFSDPAGDGCHGQNRAVTVGERYDHTTAGPVALCLPTRVGHTFGGWRLDDGSPVTNATVVATSSDHTLSALWTPNTYTLTYADPDGTGCHGTTAAVTYGAAYGPLCLPARTGHTLDAWTLGGALITAVTEVATAADHSLAAAWVANAYTVTYVDPDGTGCDGDMRSVTYGQRYDYTTGGTVSLCQPVRAGYSFVGWNADSGGRQDPISNGTPVTVAANHDLVAAWFGGGCAANQYSDGSSCQTCHPNCATCSGSATFCTSCPPGAFRYGTQCVPSCPGATFGLNGECSPCPAGCATCTSASACTSCTAGSFLSGGACSPCDPGCATCEGAATSCTSCTAPMLRYGNQCVEACPSGTFRAEDEGELTPTSLESPVMEALEEPDCLSCHPSCAACAGPKAGQCTACPAGATLTDGSCVPNISGALDVWPRTANVINNSAITRFQIAVGGGGAWVHPAYPYCAAILSGTGTLSSLNAAKNAFTYTPSGQAADNGTTVELRVWRNTGTVSCDFSSDDAGAPSASVTLSLVGPAGSNNAAVAVTAGATLNGSAFAYSATLGVGSQLALASGSSANVNVLNASVQTYAGDTRGAACSSGTPTTASRVGCVSFIGTSVTYRAPTTIPGDEATDIVVVQNGSGTMYFYVRLVKAVQVTAGSKGHACAVSSLGHYKCWGHNLQGQLGFATAGDVTDPSTVPWIPGLAGRAFVQISAGHDHTCARLSDGTAVCWGNNATGELGIGITASVSSVHAATPIALGTDPSGAPYTFTDIRAGANMTCGLRSDGRALCWGLNDVGQLGVGSAFPGVHATPQVVTFRAAGSPSGAVLTNAVTSISPAPRQYETYVCAVLNDGSGWCWGHAGSSVAYNRLGGATGAAMNRASPFPVSQKPAGRSFKRIVAGYGHACTILDNDAVSCFGEAYWSNYPNTSTLMFASADLVAVGAYMGVVVTGGGTSLRTWGYPSPYNSLGAAVNTTVPYTSAITPALNLGAATVVGVASVNASQTSTGDATTTLVLRSDGQVQCFGRNNSGQCGNGTTSNATTPVTTRL